MMNLDQLSNEGTDTVKDRLCYYTVVSDNINIMKTTIEFNFYLYQAFNSIDKQKHGNKEKLSILKNYFLIAC